MLSILSKQELVRNVYLLSRQFIAGESVKDTTELRPFYHKFIKSHQPYQPVNVSNSFIVKDEEVVNLLKKAYQPGELDDMNQLKMIGGEHEPEYLRNYQNL